MFDKASVTPSSFHLPGVVHLSNPKKSFSGPENTMIGPILGSFCVLSQTISIRYYGRPRANKCFTNVRSRLFENAVSASNLLLDSKVSALFMSRNLLFYQRLPQG